eukprot:756884-Hanusia_phi.AAC.4
MVYLRIEPAAASDEPVTIRDSDHDCPGGPARVTGSSSRLLSRARPQSVPGLSPTAAACRAAHRGPRPRFTG